MSRRLTCVTQAFMATAFADAPQISRPCPAFDFLSARVRGLANRIGTDQSALRLCLEANSSPKSTQNWLRFRRSHKHMGKVIRTMRRFSNFSRGFRSEFAAVGFFQCDKFVGQSLNGYQSFKKSFKKNQMPTVPKDGTTGHPASACRGRRDS
jgi:hypothetical protein